MIKKYFSILKRSIGYIRFNLGTALLFLLMYTATAQILLTGIYKLFDKLMLTAAGVTYIGNDTFKKVFTHPVNIFLIIVFFLISGFIFMAQTAGFIWIFHESSCGRKISILDAFSLSLASAAKVFRLRNLQVIVFTVLLIPFLGLFSLSNVAFSVKIPGFIMDFIKANKFLGPAFTVFVLIIAYMVLNRIFSFPYFILEKEPFYNEAVKKSSFLIKGRRIKIVASYLLSLVLTVAFAAVISLIAVLIILLFNRNSPEFLRNHLCYDAVLIIFAVVMFLLPAVTVALISGYFYACTEELEIQVKASPPVEIRNGRKFSLVLLIAVAATAASLIANYAVIRDNPVCLIERPGICAHRGDSVRCPENTMPAFKLALTEPGVTSIELDVHQTNDDVIVVTHDDSLLRIAGSDKCVHEISYDELMQMETGSWFSEEFKGLHVSRLDEVLEVVGMSNVRLMIEIKPTGFDRDIEQAVIDLIKKYDMEQQCMISSLNHDVLKKVKELDPFIETVYCLNVLGGEFEKIECVDAFSVEESVVTEDLVSRIHAMGNTVYVWTVNSDETVQDLIYMGVDALATDDPVMLQEALNNCDYFGGFAKVIRGLFQ